MTITANHSLATQLKAAVSRVQYCSILETALGASRRVIAQRNGTVFRNCALTGAFTVNGQGAITSLGVTSGTTVNLAANLSTGNSTLRIEGNGNWIVGTLGLAGSGCDFIISTNPTTSNGFAFTSIAISPPAALPISGAPSEISAMRIMLGEVGSQQELVVASQLYTDMSIGFAGVTQKRWRTQPVNLQAYVLDTNAVEQIVPGKTIAVHAMPALDSNGRADIWFFADAEWDVAGVNGSPGARTADNRQYCKIDLSVFLSDVAQDVWGGTTYTTKLFRATSFRWESAAMPWRTTTAEVRAQISAGKIMPHITAGTGIIQNILPVGLDYATATNYKPFKEFGAINQALCVGDQLRSTAAGGERMTIGLVHEYVAQFIAEVGTHGNSAYNTADRVKTMKNLAESMGQFAITGGMLSPNTGRLIDPANDPSGPFYYAKTNNGSHYTHLLPMPGVTIFDGTGGGFYPVVGTSQANSAFDPAHPPDLVSAHAARFSNDPYYIMLAQSQAMAMLGASPVYGNRRGVDGKMYAINNEEDRGWWWSILMIQHAADLTPGDMPAPFLNKSQLVTLRDNSLQNIKTTFIGNRSNYESKICDDMGCLQAYTTTWIKAGVTQGQQFYGIHNLSADYGNIVVTAMRRMGVTTPLFLEVTEWHARNLKFRLGARGDFYRPPLVDRGSSNPLDEINNVALIVGPLTGPDLPYTTPAGFAANYPAPGKITGDSVPFADWCTKHSGVDFGNYTFLTGASAKCYRHLTESYAINCGFDIAAEQTAFEARILPPVGGEVMPRFTSKHYFDFSYTF